MSCAAQSRHLALSFGLIASLPILYGQALDPMQHPAVGVRVVRPQNADEVGSGFVISVDNEAVYILTARHLFYSGRTPDHDNIEITFALDPFSEHPAELYLNFENLDLAVLKISTAKLPASLAALLNNLPPIKVRSRDEPLKLKEDIFLLGGKFQDWQLPKDTISGLQDSIDRLDRFRFTGTGVHGGFSGSAVLDSANRLVGIHLGGVPSDDSYGRAQRIDAALSILRINRVPMNKLEQYSQALEMLESRAKAEGGAKPAAGDIKLNRADGLNYVWIPSGSFRMGCSTGDYACHDDEKPAHKVTITHGFWLGQTLVTQAAYSRIMNGANPAPFRSDDSSVSAVTWEESNSYCKEIGGRLPTEAEWEYAARAGSSDSLGVTIDGKNAWSLYNMLAYLPEWTADWYSKTYYHSWNGTDPRGPANGQRRVTRGDSSMQPSAPDRFAVSARSAEVPSNRGPAGFRCVVETLP